MDVLGPLLLLTVFAGVDRAAELWERAYVQSGSASPREFFLPGEEFCVSISLPPGQLLWLSGWCSLSGSPVWKKIVSLLLIPYIYIFSLNPLQALSFQGRLKYLHGQNVLQENGTCSHAQLALFTIAVPVHPPPILEIRAKMLLFQSKHKLDFTPMFIDSR